MVKKKATFTLDPRDIETLTKLADDERRSKSSLISYWIHQNERANNKPIP